MEVLVVLFEMLVKVIDPVSKDSYLDLRGSLSIIKNSFTFDPPALRSRWSVEPLRRGYIKLVYAAVF